MSWARRLRVGAIYVGAALGPFGGGVVAPMLPQIGHSLGVSADAAAMSVTAYFVPFAAAQLVSGTLGERWGRRRTVLAAYLVYLVAAVAAALAPTLDLFLVARVVLGLANAFTSPLLLAGLADMVPADRLSRSVGLFASCQAGGQSFAPLVSGLTAEVSWRWAFAVVALAAALLTLAPPPGRPRPGVGAPPWRPLFSGPMALLSVAGLVSYLGSAGLPFLVSLYAENQLALVPRFTGLALVGYGVAGLLLGSGWGRLTERAGARRCGAIGALVAAGFVAAVGHTHGVWGLTLCWTLAGAASSMLTVALQNLTVRMVPDNRGGALSAVSAFRFAGAAIAPPLWLPIYLAHPGPSFAAAGASLLLATVALPLLPTPRPIAATAVTEVDAAGPGPGTSTMKGG